MKMSSSKPLIYETKSEVKKEFLNVVVVLFTKLAPREGQPLLRGLEPMITTH
jgi:7,8-dihydro-6-hydroxymethylpterin-pyrophosphokinase